MEPLLDEPVQLTLELAGVFVFGLSGGLLAVRKSFDVVGIGVLAFLTALGGGLIRDTIIGDVPPAAFADTRYLVVPLAAAVVVFTGHQALERLHRAVLVFDGAGLGLFSVTGTLKALAFGLGPLQAALLGVLTAVGGGVLRDVVARDTPVLVRADSTQYAVPAFAGALVIVAATRADVYRPLVGLVVVLGVFAWRMLALWRGWRAPVAMRWGHSR
ncbi:MAG TPA: trimeric intracellular cation channel family protein [Euzebya sp.]|nr:trimeric intracellular cation channel family protein [Euzebya sp.]